MRLDSFYRTSRHLLLILAGMLFFLITPSLSLAAITSAQCGDAEGVIYYTEQVMSPQDAGYELCDNDGVATNLSFSKTIWSRDCPAEDDCSAKNRSCDDADASTSSEEIKRCAGSTAHNSSKSNLSDRSFFRCGDSKKEGAEECDDGNTKNGDGCSNACQKESPKKEHEAPRKTDSKKSSSKKTSEKSQEQETPAMKLSEEVRAMVATLRKACQDEPGRGAKRASTLKDLKWTDRFSAESLLTVYCITSGYKNRFYGKHYLGVGEAIKMVAKIIVLQQGGDLSAFNETKWWRGTMPYKDIRANARYTPYVLYMHHHGYLDGFTDKNIFKNHLKPLAPIKRHQFDLLLDNVSGLRSHGSADSLPIEEQIFRELLGDMADSFSRSSSSQGTSSKKSSSKLRVTRTQAAEEMVSAFPDLFRNAGFLVGNNVYFYEQLIMELQRRTPNEQRGFVTRMVEKLNRLNADDVGEIYRLDIETIADLLKGSVGLVDDDGYDNIRNDRNFLPHDSAGTPESQESEESSDDPLGDFLKDIDSESSSSSSSRQSSSSSPSDNEDDESIEDTIEESQDDPTEEDIADMLKDVLSGL